jgi:hypothetical protein
MNWLEGLGIVGGVCVVWFVLMRALLRGARIEE